MSFAPLRVCPEPRQDRREQNDAQLSLRGDASGDSATTSLVGALPERHTIAVCVCVCVCVCERERERGRGGGKKRKKEPESQTDAH
jgi:hypothetical protein